MLELTCPFHDCAVVTSHENDGVAVALFNVHVGTQTVVANLLQGFLYKKRAIPTPYQYCFPFLREQTRMTIIATRQEP